MADKILILSTSQLYTREWSSSSDIFISTAPLTDFKEVAEKFMEDHPETDKLYLYEMSKNFLCCVDVCARKVTWEDDYLYDIERDWDD